MTHVFVGFGFGPIQSGLFAREAYAGGRFSEIAISEIDAELVEAVRNNGNRYALNIAHSDGVEVAEVENVLMLNPLDPADAADLRGVLQRATEMATSLPSVDFYARGGSNSVAALIADALRSDATPATIIYTAENNTHAAEALEAAVAEQDAGSAEQRPHQFLNTVIAKMSQVITDPDEIERRDLTPMTPTIQRAFLVEAFSHILVNRTNIPGFIPGIDVFEEKDDLPPFEEAKLYGHNAIHALLAFLGTQRGAGIMSELADMSAVMTLAEQALLSESGAALIAKYGAETDPLFTTDGFRLYAEDLLGRIVNPHLGDSVARAARDPIRKLGPNDRIFGAMRLALNQRIEPTCLAAGAAAGLTLILQDPDTYALPDASRLKPTQPLTTEDVSSLLDFLWQDHPPVPEQARIADLVVRHQARV